MFVNNKIKNLGLLIVAVGFFLFTEFQCYAQTRVAFLNCQNLFDTINTPDTDDGEFSVNGSRKWDSKKYFSKVTALSEVLKELNADVLGLCEVENREVVEDLAKASGGEYNIVHYESRDSRGIDVCLLYRDNIFEVVESEMLFENLAPRGILKVAMKSHDERFILYVAHLPSQRGGASAKQKRQEIIKALESDVGQNIGGNLIVMGDMNTEPITLAGTTNLATPLAKKGLGSYCYRGVWSMLDQILVSPSLISRCSDMKLHIPNSIENSVQKNQQPTDHFGVLFILQM